MGDWLMLTNLNGWFIAIFHILRQWFDLVGAITWKKIHVACSNLMHVTNKQFSDEFDNW